MFLALSEVFDPSHDALSDRARFCDHTEPYTGDIHTDFSQLLLLEMTVRRMVMLFYPG